MLAFGDQVTFASPDSGLLEAEGLLDARLWVRTGSESGDGQSCLFEVVPLRPGEGEVEVAGQPVLYGCLIQLRHVRSGLFVALRERVLAHLEPDCLQVELSASDSSCWLSVQPGSSASRAEGECVREGDRVLLLSAKTRQQLHCSAHTLPDLEPRERLSALAALQHGPRALTRSRACIHLALQTPLRGSGLPSGPGRRATRRVGAEGRAAAAPWRLPNDADATAFWLCRRLARWRRARGWRSIRSSERAPPRGASTATPKARRPPTPRMRHRCSGWVRTWCWCVGALQPDAVEAVALCIPAATLRVPAAIPCISDCHPMHPQADGSRQWGVGVQEEA